MGLRGARGGEGYLLFSLQRLEVPKEWQRRYLPSPSILQRPRLKIWTVRSRYGRRFVITRSHPLSLYPAIPCPISLSQALERLQKKDEAATAMEGVKQQEVRVFKCETCGKLSERPDPDCRDRSHQIKMVTAVKRFYECAAAGCNERTTALNNRFPPPCRKCGGAGWKKCGAGPRQKTGGSMTGDGPGLITAMSEHTSWRTRQAVSVQQDFL